MTPLAAQLRALRVAAGLTLREACARTALSQSALSDIERGRRRPSLETLEKLLVVYQMRLAIVPAQPPAASVLLQRLREGQLTTGEQEQLAELLDDSLQIVTLVAGLVDEQPGGIYAQLRQLHSAVRRHQAALSVLLEAEGPMGDSRGLETPAK